MYAWATRAVTWQVAWIRSQAEHSIKIVEYSPSFDNCIQTLVGSEALASKTDI